MWRGLGESTTVRWWQGTYIISIHRWLINSINYRLQSFRELGILVVSLWLRLPHISGAVFFPQSGQRSSRNLGWSIRTPGCFWGLVYEFLPPNTRHSPGIPGLQYWIYSRTGVPNPIWWSIPVKVWKIIIISILGLRAQSFVFACCMKGIISCRRCQNSERSGSIRIFSV